MKILTVIPARYASTRLPRKMLLCETGKPLIQHTYEAASRARIPDGVCVATDHPEIEAAVKAFGGNVLMTSVDCASGTDRLVEVARQMTDVDIFVNVQGDEPDMNPDTVDTCASLLVENQGADMATMAIPLRSKAKLEDPNCVKVVFDKNQKALYFSRSVIPYPRNWSDDLLDQTPSLFWQHLGIYAYRRDFLLHLGSLPVCALEKAEKLEQLRVLNEGYPILVGTANRSAIGIDTPEDYAEFVKNVRRSELK